MFVILCTHPNHQLVKLQMKIKDRINIQIGGEIGKFNSLPVDYLVEIAKNLQNLLQTIARVSVSDGDTIDLNNFKVELVGFTTGSAVPSFSFTNRIQPTFGSGIQKQRETVSNKFEELMKVSEIGDFEKIKILYPEGYRRNEIVDSLYGFTKSFGTAPVNIVEIETKNNRKEITPLYKMRKFNKEAKDALTVRIIENKDPEIYEDISIRRVKTTTKNGLKSTKTLEEYSNKKASLSYAPRIIVHQDTIYELLSPLRCLLEKEEDYYAITCELLDIIGCGQTIDEAELNFSQEFDYIYTRYNMLDDTKLTKRLSAIKTILNIIVKSKSNGGS